MLVTGSNLQLPGHLYISSMDGHLYDLRKTEWSKLPALRRTYRRTSTVIETTLELRATLRAGNVTWPGGYPLYLFTSDNAALCYDCCRNEYRQVSNAVRNYLSDGWRVVGCDINHEDSELHCSHCNDRIPAAYGDDEE